MALYYERVVILRRGVDKFGSLVGFWQNAKVHILISRYFNFNRTITCDSSLRLFYLHPWFSILYDQMIRFLIFDRMQRGTTEGVPPSPWAEFHGRLSYSFQSQGLCGVIFPIRTISRRSKWGKIVWVSLCYVLKYGAPELSPLIWLSRVTTEQRRKKTLTSPAQLLDEGTHSSRDFFSGIYKTPSIGGVIQQRPCRARKLIWIKVTVKNGNGDMVSLPHMTRSRQYMQPRQAEVSWFGIVS